MKDRILINKKLIPYSFDIVLGNTLFTILVKHNERHDLFTLSVYKGDKLICTEPLIYGIKLFSDIYKVGDYPVTDIVPLDESGEEIEITYDNFNEKVYLSIMDGEDDG